MSRAPQTTPVFDDLWGDMPSLSDIASLPIVRGRPAFNGYSNRWSIVGTGRRIEAARRRLEDEDRDEDADEQWIKKSIGEKFLTCMFDRSWLWFTCPRCSIPI